jgi:hypothetical protein
MALDTLQHVGQPGRLVWTTDRYEITETTGAGR